MIVPEHFCFLNHVIMNCMDRLPPSPRRPVSGTADGLFRCLQGSSLEVPDLSMEHPRPPWRCRLLSGCVTNCQFRSVRAPTDFNIQHNISLGDIMKLRTIHAVESVHNLFFAAQSARYLHFASAPWDL